MLIKRGLKHLSRVNDVLFRTLRIERDITIFPDDVFLTSYPRSGQYVDSFSGRQSGAHGRGRHVPERRATCSPTCTSMAITTCGICRAAHSEEP